MEFTKFTQEIFNALPITNGIKICPAEILATRYRCLAEVQKRTTDKVVLIDSYFEHKEHSPKLQSLGESIILMGSADIVCFANGWEEARGCRIEHQVTTEYIIPIMYEQENAKKVEDD